LDVPCLDAAVAKALAAFPPELKMVGLTQADVEGLRAALRDNAPSLDSAEVSSGTIVVDEIVIPSANRPEGIPLLIHRRAGGSPISTGVYFIHGGGFIAGDYRTGIDRLLGWSRASGATLISVDYRLAPEHSFVEMVDDCYTGLCWVAEHSEQLGFSASRLLIAGASAGGGLAAATAMLARDSGGPALSHQVLWCPMLDHRLQTASSQYEGIPWDRTSNDLGWRAALGDRDNPEIRAAALIAAVAEDLSGLPPTFLDVGTAESFRDEVLDYATRLLAAGVPTELHVWLGGTHGFDRYANGAEVSIAARQAQTGFLNRIGNHDI
jgi:acetyl esterase/lipase